MSRTMVNLFVRIRTWLSIFWQASSLPIPAMVSRIGHGLGKIGGTRSPESVVRAGYWIIGIVAGAFLTYSTRHFINGDAINYIEMGEALRYGRWSDLVNLTASPGYAFLLGLGQLLLDTNRGNEVPLLKWVNFICLIFALGACDVLVQYLKPRFPYVSREVCLQLRGEKIPRSAGLVEPAVPPDAWLPPETEWLRREREKPLPQQIVLLLAYGMCLFSVLNWVRPRLIAPEMAVFALVLATATVILWIKDNPRSYVKFGVLGVCTGVSYLFKTFFFPFSVVFFGVAAIATRSLRLAVPRLMVAVLVMLAVSAPLLYGLSVKVGRFSFGETGKLNYAKYVAGRGESVHKPIVLAEKPRVLVYRDNPYVNSTRPASFDPSYWTHGIEPVFMLSGHLRLLAKHLWEIFNDRLALSICFCLWCLWLLRTGALRPRKGWLTSPPVLLALPAVAGIVLYSIIHVEMRYVAPFLFLGFLAVVLQQRHHWRIRRKRRKATAFAMVVVCLTLGLTLSSVADQTIRSLVSNAQKPSYSEAYRQMVALKDFLHDQGVRPGTDVAVVGLPPYYWGRMAGLRIIAEIPNKQQILTASAADRRQAVAALQEVGVNLVVASGQAFAKLNQEGWHRVPGTRDFYAFMSGKPSRPGILPPDAPVVVPQAEYRTADGAPVERRAAEQ